MPNQLSGQLIDLSVANRHCSATMALERSKLEQRVLAVNSIPLTHWRVWDALHTNLPGTSASDDLALTTGTWGSSASYIGTGAVNTTTVTRYAGCVVPLPLDYDQANQGTVVIRAHAGMKTTVADGSATIDFEAYRYAKDGTLDGSDIVAHAAQSINSLTKAEYDFELTNTDLEPGDQIAVRMKVAVADTSTNTNVIAAVYQVELLADLR